MDILQATSDMTMAYDAVKQNIVKISNAWYDIWI